MRVIVLGLFLVGLAPLLTGEPVRADDVEPDVREFADLAGRMAPAVRAALVQKYGGTKESEAAVAKGLAWLVAQQLDDGSWSFGMVSPGARGGTYDCRTGATGMALLALLGAGHTPLVGEHREAVHEGLQFLMKAATVRGNAVDLGCEQPRYARIYSHCIATRALCEALAMWPIGTKVDPKLPRAEAAEARRRLRLLNRFRVSLKKGAQGAVNYIVLYQDPRGGGWRYSPKDRGDTSVSSWAVSALRSADAAGLKVPPTTAKGALVFLQSVEVRDSGHYGYTSPAPNRPGTTAAGTMCRFTLDPKYAGNARGVAYLAGQGPSLNNMYYTYYATDVMFHSGGDDWKTWNAACRDQLVRAQRANGSWPAAGSYSTGGGDLLQTCFCLFALEVYYRHLAPRDT